MTILLIHQTAVMKRLQSVDVYLIGSGIFKQSEY